MSFRVFSIFPLYDKEVDQEPLWVGAEQYDDNHDDDITANFRLREGRAGL